MTRPIVQSCSVAEQETGSEQQLESEKAPCLLSPTLFNIESAEEEEKLTSW